MLVEAIKIWPLVSVVDPLMSFSRTEHHLSKMYKAFLLHMIKVVFTLTWSLTSHVGGCCVL